MSKISWSLSAGRMFDGKSICLWRHSPGIGTKIARFQDDASAKIFAEEFGFPVNDDVQKRFDAVEKEDV